MIIWDSMSIFPENEVRLYIFCAIRYNNIVSINRINQKAVKGWYRIQKQAVFFRYPVGRV